MEGEPGNLSMIEDSSFVILSVFLLYLLYRVACIQYFWHFSNKNARNEFIHSNQNIFSSNSFLSEHFRLDISMVMSNLFLVATLFWIIFGYNNLFYRLPFSLLYLCIFLFFGILYFFTTYLPRQKQINHINSFNKTDYLILFVLSIFFLPISILFGTFLQRLNHWIHSYAQKLIEKQSKNDLENALELSVGNEQSDAAEKEAELLKSVVKFGEVAVRQIMKSRVDIISIDKNDTFENVVNVVIDSGFSRFPVYEEDLDTIVGLLYVKDLLKFMKSEPREDWQKLIRTNLIFVPESKKIDELLREFQSEKFHLAIVIDEFGSTSGIVTLEDIVEEIVGEIKDEFDDDTEVEYSKIDDHNYLFEGKTLLNDVCRIIEVDTATFDDTKGNADSLAGLLLELIGELPEINEEIKYNDFSFKVVAVNKRRIEKVKITLPSDEI